MRRRIYEVLYRVPDSPDRYWLPFPGRFTGAEARFQCRALRDQGYRAFIVRALHHCGIP
jgi:hypothetical protein